MVTGQCSLFSYRKACFVEMTFHMFMLKRLSEEIAYLQSLGKMREMFRWKLLQERFRIPFIPPSQPRPPTLFIPSSFIYSPSAELRKSENRPRPCLYHCFSARELQQDSSPDTSPPGEGTSLSPASLPITVTATSFRPGMAVCVVCDHCHARLKSGSISISK